MLRQVRSHVASTPRALRIFFVVFVSVIVSLLGTLEYTELPQEYFEQHAYKQNGGAYRIPKGKPPSVHLVVAATAEEDYSWVHQLKVPGLTVVPYIAEYVIWVLLRTLESRVVIYTYYILATCPHLIIREKIKGMKLAYIYNTSLISMRISQVYTFSESSISTTDQNQTSPF